MLKQQYLARNAGGEMRHGKNRIWYGVLQFLRSFWVLYGILGGRVQTSGRKKNSAYEANSGGHTGKGYHFPDTAGGGTEA